MSVCPAPPGNVEGRIEKVADDFSLKTALGAPAAEVLEVPSSFPAFMCCQKPKFPLQIFMLPHVATSQEMLLGNIQVAEKLRVIIVKTV